MFLKSIVTPKETQGNIEILEDDSCRIQSSQEGRFVSIESQPTEFQPIESEPVASQFDNEKPPASNTGQSQSETVLSVVAPRKRKIENK